MPGTNSIVMYLAFDRNDHGEAVPAFEPRQAANEEEAVSEATRLAQSHAGAIAWRRDTWPAIGELGEPELIYQSGTVGDFD